MFSIKSNDTLLSFHSVPGVKKMTSFNQNNLILLLRFSTGAGIKQPARSDTACRRRPRSHQTSLPLKPENFPLRCITFCFMRQFQDALEFGC